MCDICGSSCSVGVSHEEGIVKGKFHLITGDEGPEEEERYSSILSLTSAIGGGGWLTPWHRHFAAGNDPEPIV